MTGLRGKHKAERQRRILESASRLFRKADYEGTRIDAIAAEAEVSIGTIYNYYQNKGDILVAIVSMQVNDILRKGQRIVDKPPASAAKAVDALVVAYLDRTLAYLSKDMWRRAMATSIQQPDSPFGKAYNSLDQALMDQTCALIEKLRVLGLVRRDIDGRGVGEMIFNNINMMFIEFAKNESMQIKELHAAIRRQNRVLVQAIAV